MDEARVVVQRLERIEELAQEGAPSSKVLVELRVLVHEAEAWLRAEPEPGEAVAAVARCRTALGIGAEGAEVMPLLR